MEPHRRQFFMNICRDTVEYKINLTETALQKKLCKKSFAKKALQKQPYRISFTEQRRSSSAITILNTL